MPRVIQKNPTDFEKPEFQAALNDFSRLYLAEGDSWFSFGSGKLHNLLTPLQLPQPSCILNIAQPGDTLRRMHETTRNPEFFRFLQNRGGRRWDAIFLSGGGNDLIDALWDPDRQTSEILIKPADPQQVNESNLESVIDEAALDALFDFIKTNVTQIVTEGRDGTGSNSRGVPLLMHTYALMQPRNAPAIFLGQQHGPWVQPACVFLGIDESLWLDLSGMLTDKLADCLLSLNLPNFHVIDTLSADTGIEPAEAGTTGDSRDWENEIHPNRGGYRKLAATWAEEINRLLP